MHVASIRNKTLIGIGSILVALIVVLYGFSRAIIQEGYEKLEYESVARNVQRAINALEDEQATLHSISLDWAHWDDTYNYAQGLFDTFIDMNLTDSVLANYNLQFAIFVNASGQVIYTQGYDPITQERIAVAANLIAFVAQHDTLLIPRDRDGNILRDGITGLATLSDAIIMLGATPILLSSSEGEPSGTLIWGRYVDEALINRLAARTQLGLSISSATSMSAVTTDTLAMILDQQSLVQPIDDVSIAGYTLLRDFKGDPALILKIEMPRSIYQQGQKSISYFLLSLALFSVITAVTIALMLEKSVLSRLAYLNNRVNEIQHSGDASLRLNLAGDDELTNLSTNINAMLHALQAQEKLKLARDNAIEVARLRAEILANVSHDARTPLTVIQMRSEMLQEGFYGTLNSKQNEVLGNIMTSSHQLMGFVNNLLEGAQLETGQLKLNITEMEPAKLVDIIKTTLEPLAVKKQLCLDLALSEDMPPLVYGDEKRIERILTNLVNNAIKFTNTGSITVRIYQPDSGHWALEVKDTGIGISSEHQQWIFTPFWQVDGTTTRSANSGVGLGLAIVHQLATLMGGYVTVNSTVGKGTTFTVMLPLQIPMKGTINAEPALRHDH